MAYDWYDEIDRIGWNFEDEVQQATSDQNHSLGMAPSAGDEVRNILRQTAAVAPKQLLDEAENTSRRDVETAVSAVAIAAVEAAISRGSRHITREDVRIAVQKVGTYPFIRS